MDERVQDSRINLNFIHRPWFACAVSLLTSLSAAIQASLYTDEFVAILSKGLSYSQIIESGETVAVTNWLLVLFLILILVSLGSGSFGIYGMWKEGRLARELLNELGSLKTRLNFTTQEYAEIKQDQYLLRKSLSDTYKLRLKEFCRKLQFDTLEDNCDRISVYLPSSTDKGSFYLAVRYSPNPEWDGKSKRAHPNSKGALAKAWRNGSCYVCGLPATNRSKDLKRYKSYQRQNFDYTNAEIEAFRMKSRLYFGWSVNNLNNTGAAGVVIIESVQPTRWSRDSLMALLESEKEHLRAFVDNLTKQQSWNDYINKAETELS